jgi:hypothetical protein
MRTGLAGLLLYISASAFAAEAAPAPAPLPAGAENPAEWQKVETKHQPLQNVRQFLSPGVFDQELQHIISFPKDGTGVELDFPHAGKDEKGKDYPALEARFLQDYIWVDLNGDGKNTADETRRVTPGGYSDAFTATLHYEDGSSAPYNFVFKSLVDKEQYAVIRMSSRVATAQEQRITLLDDNGNGKYNDIGKDAVMVGENPVALLGKYILLGDQFYELLVHAAGASIEVRPAMAMDLGTIDMFEGHEITQKSADLRIHTVIVSGLDASFSFDPNRRKLKVPAGSYDIAFGLFERASEIVYMRKGEKTSFSVIKDEVAAPKWGGEVTAKIEVISDGSSVTFMPPTFFGKASEQYFPENYRKVSVMAHLAQIWTDSMRIDRIKVFGNKKYDVLPNGMIKPVSFPPYRNGNDQYEAAVDYSSGIIGKAVGKQRFQFVYKSKTAPKK